MAHVLRAEFTDPDGLDRLFLVEAIVPGELLLTVSVEQSDGVSASIRLNGWSVGLLINALRRFLQLEE